VNTDADLYLYIRKNNTLTDPSSVRQVEILDTDGETVLETIASGSITHSATGTYKVTADGDNLDAVGTYYDKWYVTRESGDEEEEVLNDFYVSSATVGIGKLTGSEIRSEVENNLGRSDKAGSVARWVKLAIVDVKNLARFTGMESTFSFTTEEDDGEYTLDTDIEDDSGYGIQKVVKLHLDDGGESHQIDLITKQQLDKRHPDPTNNTGRPFEAALWGRAVYLRPIPDGEYTVTGDSLVDPPDIGDDETFVLDGLDWALICKATEYGMLGLNEPMKAGEWGKRFREAIEAGMRGDKELGDYKLGAFRGSVGASETQSYVPGYRR